MSPHFTYFDAELGVAEERSETYKLYDERVPEVTTTLSAKSADGIDGCAVEQVGAVRGMWL